MTYRQRSLELVERIAERFRRHPAVVLWHVGNESGNHVGECFCDRSAQRFRDWLTRRYGDLDGLNAAWGTSFWSQRYSDWAEVLPPRATPTFPNPGQRLDWRRFCSDELLDQYLAEREVLRRHPDRPVTTNFVGFRPTLDYWSWAPHLDVVAQDTYQDPADPRTHVDAAMVADLMRGLGDGRPWLLMEQTTARVNWRGRNVAKRPGQYRLWSLQAVARGSDAVLHFQWRQSAAGAEKWHSAMVGHDGAVRPEVWRWARSWPAWAARMARWARWAWAVWPGPGSRPTRRCCSPGRPGGRSRSRRSRRPSSTTSPRPGAGTAPPGTRASPSTSSDPARTWPAGGWSSCRPSTCSPTRTSPRWPGTSPGAGRCWSAAGPGSSTSATRYRAAPTRRGCGTCSASPSPSTSRWPVPRWCGWTARTTRSRCGPSGSCPIRTPRCWPGTPVATSTGRRPSHGTAACSTPRRRCRPRPRARWSPARPGGPASGRCCRSAAGAGGGPPRRDPLPAQPHRRAGRGADRAATGPGRPPRRAGPARGR